MFNNVIIMLLFSFEVTLLICLFSVKTMTATPQKLNFDNVTITIWLHIYRLFI